MSDVVIVDSGVANLASIATAFRRLGATVSVTVTADDVLNASRVVLPGVGAFGAGLTALHSRGLTAAIASAAVRGTPLLGVCLGMQMLCESSEEAPGIPGLGVIAGACLRLPDHVRVPHLGWNYVAAPAPAPAPEGLRFVTGGVAAFANSYALREAPPGWTAAWSTHGVPFVAALERGSIVACQFHPELSGAYGAALLQRWLAGGGALSTDADTVVTAPGLMRRVVPCLDVRDGRVVKGVRFQRLRDAGDPAARAACYEAQGADEIVVLDVAASPEGRKTQVETVARVRAAISIPLTAGGGVRSVSDARALLAAGADKVSVNTAAVRRPELLGELATAFGRQCVVLAIDARRVDDRWEVLALSGRERALPDAVTWAEWGQQLGAGEILLTSWDRDGTRAGPDVELLRAVCRAVRLPVIASGGIGGRAHVAEAFRAGADAVLAASVFHDGDDTVAGIKADLAGRGIRVRR
ncbi:MAG TPA: imidazole glycerol phosphate synthase subunit HisF [Gemmatimonadales bacterium]|nr:imidazole glycerol phosphate synthase subunit HisF [Gemmatimonadales bacterium]